MILVLLLNLLYAWMFIIAKFSLHTGQPIFMTAVRMLIGGIVSLAVYVMQTKSLQEVRSLTRQQWGLITLLSITGIYFCNAFEFWGLQYLSAGKTAFIYNLGPFFAALLAYFCFSEKMTMQKWIGLTLGFIGFLPILMGPADVIDTTTSFGYISVAEIALLIASLATVIGWTIMRILLQQKQISLFFINGASMVLGSLLCFAHSFLFESMPYISLGFSLPFFGYACAMALSQNIIAYNLHAYLLHRYTTTFLTFCGFLSSILAAVLGAIVLGETISTSLLVSTGIVLFGLLIFYQEELRLGYMKPHSSNIH